MDNVTFEKLPQMVAELNEMMMPHFAIVQQSSRQQSYRSQSNKS